MKIPRPPHNWSLSPARAISVQKRLAARVVRHRQRDEYRLVGGVDAAFSGDGRKCIAGVVVWDLHRRAVVEKRLVVRALGMPYIPGLLSFREAPAVIAALRRLKIVPDVLLCDGQGIAHPRRLGIASHIGLLTGMPSVGCAKSRLCGTYREPGPLRGAKAALLDNGEVIGTVLRTRDSVRPVYVSIGHLIDLPAAEGLVLACGGGYRLPEPIRLVDQAVTVRRF